MNDVRDFALEKILVAFPFELVEQHMQQVKWKWSGIKGTPTHDDMKITVLNLYRSAVRDPPWLSTGGFTVAVTSSAVKVDFRGVRKSPMIRVYCSELSEKPIVSVKGVP